MAKYEKWLTHEGLVRIGGWSRDGLTDEQIAHNMGISRSTLNVWRKKYSDISDTISKGKDVVDREVENALLNRAMGTTTTDKMYRMVHKDDEILDMEQRQYQNAWKLEHPAATIKQIRDAAIAAVPEYKRIQQTENIHEFPPDVNAAIFWLRNRKPTEYRDQSFQQLNEAQTNKAQADARISNHKADELEGVGRTNPLLVALNKQAKNLLPKDGDADADTTE